jgi:nitrogen fixation NifU-like protein
MHAEERRPHERRPAESRELREELILDLARSRPGFRRELSGEVRQAERSSPTCGDRITMRVVLQNGILTEVGWDGRGCAVSTASAGVLSGLIPGTPADRVPALLDEIRRVVGPFSDPRPSTAPDVGDMVLFEGMGRLPLRARCALLAWEALADAVGRPAESVAG